MALINLKYGRDQIRVDFDEGRFDVLGSDVHPVGISDVEIGERLDAPIGSPPLTDIVRPSQTVLLVVPDATRQAGADQIVNLLTRRLIAAGVMPYDINIIFATGIHRPVTPEEKDEILTPFITQRMKTLDHSPRDLMRIVRVGETSGGIAIELNRALMEYDHIVLIGAVGYHYFAGFTGARKLICPGLGGSRTIAATHKIAFDCAIMDRRNGVGPGILDGNPVHEAFEECAAPVKNVFAVNTIMSQDGRITDLFCGDRIPSHRAACEAYDAAHKIELPEKRPLVIVDAGGAPYDINLIQAHKSLDAAAAACSLGGTIVFIAECFDGLGRSDFLNWFEAGTSGQLAERLCESYQVNGQTAWTLLRKAENYNVEIVCSLPEDDVEKMRMKKVGNIGGRLDELMSSGERGYIIPSAAKYRFV